MAEITKIQLKTRISTKELSDINLDLGEPLVNIKDKTLIIGGTAHGDTDATKNKADNDSNIILGASSTEVGSASADNTSVTITHKDPAGDSSYKLKNSDGNVKFTSSTTPNQLINIDLADDIGVARLRAHDESGSKYLELGYKHPEDSSNSILNYIQAWDASQSNASGNPQPLHLNPLGGYVHIGNYPVTIKQPGESGEPAQTGGYPITVTDDGKIQFKLSTAGSNEDTQDATRYGIIFGANVPNNADYIDSYPVFGAKSEKSFTPISIATYNSSQNSSWKNTVFYMQEGSPESNTIDHKNHYFYTNFYDQHIQCCGIHIDAKTEIDSTDTTGPFTILSSTKKLLIDGDEIQVKTVNQVDGTLNVNSADGGTLHLNPAGGDVMIGSPDDSPITLTSTGHITIGGTREEPLITLASTGDIAAQNIQCSGLYIKSSVDAAVGSTGVSAPLRIGTDTNSLYVDANEVNGYSISNKQGNPLYLNAFGGKVYIGSASYNASDLQLRNGNIICTSSAKVEAGSFNALSDARLKENFRSFATEKSILDLPIYKFDFIDGHKNQIGCKAQDLQEICPEIVAEGADGYLSIQESKIVYLLLEEVKNLKAEIEELKKEG